MLSGGIYMSFKPGPRFEHDPSVIAFAYQLVKEYEEHGKEQDRVWYEKHPNLTKPEPERKSTDE